MTDDKKKVSGRGRSKGMWVAIAAGRARIPRDLVNGHGLSNVPKVGEVGSAAYRRLMASRTR